MKLCLCFRLDAKSWSTPRSVFYRCLTNSTAVRAVCAWILWKVRQALWDIWTVWASLTISLEMWRSCQQGQSFPELRYSGRTNAKLVEITRINHTYRDEGLPSRLTEAVMRLCGDRADAAELAGAAWTSFAELIDNIFSHSNTPLDGYAALQLYPNGNSLQVAVSDSGLGIMSTLRPALKHEFPGPRPVIGH